MFVPDDLKLPPKLLAAFKKELRHTKILENTDSRPKIMGHDEVSTSILKKCRTF